MVAQESWGNLSAHYIKLLCLLSAVGTRGGGGGGAGGVLTLIDFL